MGWAASCEKGSRPTSSEGTSAADCEGVGRLAPALWRGGKKQEARVCGKQGSLAMAVPGARLCMGALERAAREAGEKEAAVDKDPATMDARGNVGCVDYMVRGVCDGQGPCSQGTQDRLPMEEYQVRQGICKVGGADGRAVEAWRGGVKGDEAMDA